jgi:two-component system, chemotaxis family, response regulator PixG
MTTALDKVYSLPEGCSPAQLARTLQQVIQSQVNGQIEILTNTDQQWNIDFRVGRLVWATGGDHRFRRWQRLLRQFCPGIPPNSVQLREKEIFLHWEYLALNVLLKRQQISRETAAALVATNLTEIFFDLLQASATVRQVSHTTDRQARLDEPVAIVSPQDVFGGAVEQFQIWAKLGLNAVSPNMAPVIQNAEALAEATSPKTFQTFNSLLKGQLSLRDLAVIMRHSLPSLAQSLVTYLQRDLISLQPIADLPTPFYAPNTAVPTKVATNLPLVVCIDDSPQICYILEETLRGSGYRCLSIQDSVQALPTLIKNKPDLIFLDLVMPVANGYEICSQIRRVVAFRNVPIVILTGNDGVVDRVRAKTVGANDFLVKPVEPEKVLNMVRRYIAAKNTAPD